MFADRTPSDPEDIIGTLISGYAVCPDDCETLEPFSLATAKELQDFPRCTHCGHALDTIMLHVVTVR